MYKRQSYYVVLRFDNKKPISISKKPEINEGMNTYRAKIRSLADFVSPQEFVVLEGKQHRKNWFCVNFSTLFESLSWIVFGAVFSWQWDSAEKPEVVIWLITFLCQLGYGINPRCWFVPWRFQKCVVVLKTWNGLLWIYLAAYSRGVATIVVIIIFDCKIIILYNV